MQSHSETNRRRNDIHAEGVSWAEATGGKTALSKEGMWLEHSDSGAGLGCCCKVAGLRLHGAHGPWKGVHTDSGNRLEGASGAEQKHH